VIAYGDESCNYVATVSATGRMKIARLALGDGAIQDQAFYASIHQKDLQGQYGKDTVQRDESAPEEVQPDFDGSEWDLIRTGADTGSEPETETEVNDAGDDKDNSAHVCAGIDRMANTLKEMVYSHDQQLTAGVSKFLTRFQNLSAPRLRPKLAAAFHQFGWELGATTALKAGQLRHGKRIAVQATAAGRRRSGTTRGKGKQVSGRPAKGAKENTTPAQPTPTRHCMPVRNAPKGRRLHSLDKNIQLGQQNAGKW
jgi:hypothetical protein